MPGGSTYQPPTGGGGSDVYVDSDYHNGGSIESGSWTAVPGISLTTPDDGTTRTYQIIFNFSFEQSGNNQNFDMRFAIGGTGQSNSVRDYRTKDTEAYTYTLAYTDQIAPDTEITVQCDRSDGQTISFFKKELIIIGTD